MYVGVSDCDFVGVGIGVGGCLSLCVGVSDCDLIGVGMGVGRMPLSVCRCE